MNIFHIFGILNWLRKQIKWCKKSEFTGYSLSPRKIAGKSINPQKQFPKKKDSICQNIEKSGSLRVVPKSNTAQRHERQMRKP